MRVKIKPKKPQLVVGHREKLSQSYSSVNGRGEPSFIEAVFSIAILLGIIWCLI